MGPTRHRYTAHALAEGVLVRGEHAVSMAVRRADGRIVTKSEAAPRTAAALRRVPFVRAAASLAEAAVAAARGVRWSRAASGPHESGGRRTEAALLAVLLAGSALMFIAGPVLMTRPLAPVSSWLQAGVETLVRAAMLAGYVAFIGRLPEARRVFAYHAAAGRALHAAAGHHRGPVFALAFGALSVVACALLGTRDAWLMVGARSLILPLAAATAYELHGLAPAGGPLRPLYAPAALFQKLTASRPDDAQVEVARIALQCAIEYEAIVALPVSRAVAILAAASDDRFDE